MPAPAEWWATPPALLPACSAACRDEIMQRNIKHDDARQRTTEKLLAAWLSPYIALQTCDLLLLLPAVRCKGMEQTNNTNTISMLLQMIVTLPACTVRRLAANSHANSDSSPPPPQQQHSRPAHT
jgi:hypothetical protein